MSKVEFMEQQPQKYVRSEAIWSESHDCSSIGLFGAYTCPKHAMERLPEVSRSYHCCAKGRKRTRGNYSRLHLPQAKSIARTFPIPTGHKSSVLLYNRGTPVGSRDLPFSVPRILLHGGNIPAYSARKDRRNAIFNNISLPVHYLAIIFLQYIHLTRDSDLQSWSGRGSVDRITRSACKNAVILWRVGNSWVTRQRLLSDNYNDARTLF